jgi:tRNA-binding EMAP/Myf-like protein
LSKDKERAPKEPKEKKSAAKKSDSDEGKWILDIRIGVIASVETHAEAESLYVLQVDVGEKGPRQVCGAEREREKERERKRERMCERE